ncbi:hypothetical protein GOBAR_DD08616 [Gossypium barbadense]|nr:hypothetical protein GOBAR_DD08616 [Gossypium barbadense]
MVVLPRARASIDMVRMRGTGNCIVSARLSQERPSPTLGIKLSNIVYEFSFPESLLDDYNIAPSKLSSFFWWLAMVYFLDCSQRSEVPMLAVFQHLYQLKGRDLENSSGFYFSPHKNVQTIIRNHCSNLRLTQGKYCSEGFSPNGWRPSNNQEVAQSNGALSEGVTWPYDSFD